MNGPNSDTGVGVAAVEGAIRNPNAPTHFMVLQPIETRFRVYRRDLLIAQTTEAVRLLEIGKKAYEPRVYIPRSDLCVELDRFDKSTHCGLKGDASYYGHGGEEIAWSYETTFDFADALNSRVAFWSTSVRFEAGI